MMSRSNSIQQSLVLEIDNKNSMSNNSPFFHENDAQGQRCRNVKAVTSYTLDVRSFYGIVWDGKRGFLHGNHTEVFKDKKASDQLTSFCKVVCHG